MSTSPKRVILPISNVSIKGWTVILCSMFVFSKDPYPFDLTTEERENERKSGTHQAHGIVQIGNNNTVIEGYSIQQIKMLAKCLREANNSKFFFYNGHVFMTGNFSHLCKFAFYFKQLVFSFVHSNIFFF